MYIEHERRRGKSKELSYLWMYGAQAHWVWQALEKTSRRATG